MEGSEEQEYSNVEETELGINLGSSFIHRESDMNEAWKSYWKSVVKKILMTDENPEHKEQHLFWHCKHQSSQIHFWMGNKSLKVIK